VYSSMQTGQARSGMQTFNQALASLYQTRQATLEDCLARSSNPEELQDMIRRGPVAVAGH
jgi:twitching motility protein PilT